MSIGPVRRAAQAASGGSDEAEADPIDRAYLARFTLGNVALEHEVLTLFASQAPLYLDRLRAAAVRKDWKEAAHTIKGSSAALGARRVARCAELAEKIDVEMLTGEREGPRDEAIAAVATAIDEVCRHIDRLLAGK